MDQVKAALELALPHLKQMETRVVEQRARIAHLKEIGASTETADGSLVTLLDSVQTVKRHIAQLTSVDTVEMASSRDGAFVLPAGDQP